MIPPSLAGASFLHGAQMQLGCAVRDLEAGIAQWTAIFGLGPWVVVHDYPGQVRHYRGERVDVEVDIAFSYWGDIQIELIHQRNDAPSPYREFHAAGGDGMQHLGFYVPDYPAAVAGLRDMGLEEVYRSSAPGAEFPTIYFSAPETVGLMVEIVALDDGRRKMLDALRALGHGWDGRDPVRHFASSRDFLRSEGLA